MNSRIPFVAAVVGALLIGGATTGGTFASWKDTSIQSGDSIKAGALAISSSVSEITLGAGTSGTVEFTITDASIGKNSLQRVTPTLTGTASGTFTSTLTRKTGASCPGIVTPLYADTTPGQTINYCLAWTMPTGSGPGTRAISFVGDQYRPGNLNFGGWTTPELVLPLKIAAPILTCPSSSSASTGTPITWTTPGGATASQVQFLNGSSWTNVSSGGTTSPYSVGSVGNKDDTRTFRVLFTGGSTATSNPVTVKQSNNGNNNQTCVVN